MNGPIASFFAGYSFDHRLSFDIVEVNCRVSSWKVKIHTNFLALNERFRFQFFPTQYIRAMDDALKIVSHSEWPGHRRNTCAAESYPTYRHDFDVLQY